MLILSNVKIIILLVTIPLLSSITFSAVDARDCSNPKGFHAKMMCRLSGNSSTSGEKKENPDSLWNKIKNFGGKNVGEAG